MLGKSLESPEDCDCAPSESERRKLWPQSISRRTALTMGAVGVAVAGAAVSPVVPRAFAAGYPSWDDVQRAKANEASKASEVSRIQGLIQSLTDEVARTQAVALQKSGEFYDAQQKFFEASYNADQLQSQADEQARAAIDAANKAGRVAAQLYRDGGDDTSLQLFFAGSAATADDLLARLGTMDKLLQRNQTVYADAVTARDYAQSLSDQAQVARTERDKLQQAAEQAMRESQAAADAAAAALTEQQSHLGDLQAQLSALQDTTSRTVAEYQEGERIRKAEEAARLERERQAAAERAAAQAERDRQNSNNGGGGGGGGGNSGGGGGGGGGGGSGWVRPSGGWRSSDYGPRSVQCGNSYCASGFHAGVDLAPGCWAPIYAASAGRITYAGYNGGYGNYVRIDHGGGLGTGYAHIVDGGIYVSYGQWVNAGQQIAAVGNTGNSFGCHLHFETYVNGSPVNPVYFMGDRGISV